MASWRRLPVSPTHSVIRFEGHNIVPDRLNSNAGRQVLWWSRSGREYSRDRIVRHAFEQLGWQILDFTPLLSALGDWQAWLQRVRSPALVWVPCFRHKDAAAAVRWASARHVPVVFDPLISAYDKQVFEQARFAEDSAAAHRLLKWEAALMQRFDAVIADTHCHADFFRASFGLPDSQVSIIPVGAEKDLFTPQPLAAARQPVRVLFLGSFIGLQGPEVIAAAARLVPEVHWTFLGDGPLKPSCEQLCRDLTNVTFTPWVPYAELPAHISAADILLGVFGASQKAGRVIPNKVYQALATGRVVVTQESAAYPAELLQHPAAESGLRFIAPGSPLALASAVRELAGAPETLPELGRHARKSYDRFFGPESVVASLNEVITALLR